MVYDVAVIGAGPGGSAAAYYAARVGLRVLLLDKAAFPRDKTCGDALTPRALHTLQDMGLLDTLLSLGHRTGNFRIVAPASHALASALPQLDDWPDYALVVPRLILDDTLRQHAMAAGAAFVGRATVTDIECTAGGVVLRTDDGGSYQARVAIIATGVSPTLLVRVGLLKEPPRMMLAARAYFEGFSALPDGLSLYHAGVPLPGYGWIFPTSATSANIGVGLCSDGIARYWLRGTARTAFDGFVQSVALREILAGARQTGAVKGYPLRADFGAHPLSGDTVLVVGEAAGLVNPLTGDGIDYALESGRIAAERVIDCVARGDLSRAALAAYDAELLMRYRHIFRFSRAVRDLCVNPLVLNRLTAIAARRPDLSAMLIRRVLGQGRIGKRNLARALFSPTSHV